MHPVILKTFGGLSLQYYIRQFLFGVVMAACVFALSPQSKNFNSAGMLLFVTLSAFLYPYARFVYESIVGFITGDNVFFINAGVMLFTKFITMAFCLMFAVFIAPIGLTYLYFYHSRNEH